jgi:hypothetical protein
MGYKNQVLSKAGLDQTESSSAIKYYLSLTYKRVGE